MSWHSVQIDPVAFSVGPIAVHWYGLMYLFGFLSAWGLAVYRTKRFNLGWSSDEIADLIFYLAMGLIIGGRIGYALFYTNGEFLRDPALILKIWEGGMSFHGGLIGGLLAAYLFARRYQRSWLEILDFAAPLVPLGLGAGRLGNFINGELWGRVTDLPWGMIFPEAGSLPRHPSQLYEFFFEGVVLFLILWFYSRKKRPLFAVSSVFLICYGVMRFLLEFVRQPDEQLSFIAFHWLTMGQLLCVPMILIGVWGLWMGYSGRWQSD